MVADSRQLFANVHQRPGMFLPKTDYCTVVAFVEGCDQGNSRGILTGFREWLIPQVGAGDNLVWWYLIAWLTDPVGPKHVHNMEPEVDARAVDMLFRLLDAFLDQRQTHNGMRKLYDDYRAWAEADDRRRQERLSRYGEEADPSVTPVRRSEPPS